MRVRERVDPKDAGGVERNPVSERPEEIRVWPSSVFGKGKGGETAQMASGDSVNELITRPPGPQADGKYPPPRVVGPVPFSPHLFRLRCSPFPPFRSKSRTGVRPLTRIALPRGSRTGPERATAT